MFNQPAGLSAMARKKVAARLFSFVNYESVVNITFDDDKPNFKVICVCKLESYCTIPFSYVKITALNAKRIQQISSSKACYKIVKYAKLTLPRTINTVETFPNIAVLGNSCSFLI